MHKNFIIPLVVYPFDIMVSINETNEQFLKSLIKKMPSQIIENLKEETILLNMKDGNRGRTIQMLEGGQTILRINGEVKTCEMYGTLAHEIFHAVHFLMLRINMPLTKKNDEAYAYLIGYLTSEIYKKI